MSYWWYGLAVFVHVQAVIVLFALFPFPTTRQWNWILSTKIVMWCSDTFGFDAWNFYIIPIIPCCLLCIDSMRDYSRLSSGLRDIPDQNARSERRQQILFSQRSYYISGAAFFLCILVPRILSLRKENGVLCQEIDRLKPVGKGIKKLMRMVNQVQQEHDSDDTDQGSRNTGNCDPIQQELLRSLVTELQQKRNREDRRGVNRQRPWNAQDMRELIEYYEHLKHQRYQDHVNNNVDDRHAGDNPTQRPEQHRLARSRFTTSPSPQYRRIFVQVPQTPTGRYGIVE